MELPILQALRDRHKYRTLIGAVPRDMLGQEAGLVMDWYKLYFDAYPEHERVDVDALESLIKLRSGYSKEQVAIVLHLTGQLRNDIDPATVKGIVAQLYELDMSGRAAALIARYNNGEELELTYELSRLSQQTMRAMSNSSPASWIDDDIAKLLEEESGDYGLKLPTHALRDHIKGHLGGTSIGIGARPDKGKTSLVAFFLTHYAKQVDKFFAPERPILWLNNEGKGSRIIPRLYQAALAKSVDEIREMSNANLLVPAYAKAVGRTDRIRVKDIHGASMAQVEQIIETMKPCIVAFDMLANIRMASATGGNKADEVEQKWQEVREMAVRHDFVALSTVQVSADGDDQLYPPYSALKDSKTGIQGATDIILMLGARNDPALQTLRGISTAKNKFQMAGKPSHVQAELIFNAETCQYSDGG
jgi:hypothetical protein